jgi:ER lumen protein retaining receptor
MMRASTIQLALAAAALLVMLVGVEAQNRPVRRFVSARHHDNHGLSLNTTHRRVRMRPGHLSHFDHHSTKRGNMASHAHMFNLFRLTGDMAHIAAFAFLLFRLQSANSCAGISLKTQELYLLVFLCRYVDLFTNFISMYNTIMKILFIGTTLYIVYLMREPLKATTYQEVEGTKYVTVLVPGCAFLALVLNDHSVSDSYFHCAQSFLWAFSIYMEAVAIVPQMVMLRRKKVVENLTANYIVALGFYRAMYLVNWAYRWFVDPISGTEFMIKVAAGLVQTALYVNFFQTYWQSRKAGQFGGDVVMDSKGYI